MLLETLTPPFAQSALRHCLCLITRLFFVTFAAAIASILFISAHEALVNFCNMAESLIRQTRTLN